MICSDLYFGNCIDYLEKLDESVQFDAIITDPPYNISINDKFFTDKINSVLTRTKIVVKNFGTWDKFESDEDFFDFTKAWLNPSLKRLKDGGHFVCFFDKFRIGMLRKICLEHNVVDRDVIIWHKTNPSMINFGNKLVSSTEFIYWAVKSDKTNLRDAYVSEYGLKHHNFFEYPIVGGKERLGHPCQKPETLTKKLVEFFTKENDIVFDPFAGSGTIPSVCQELRRRYLACEQKEEYYKMALNRIRGQTPSLFF